jgi:aminomethyltransferase
MRKKLKISKMKLATASAKNVNILIYLSFKSNLMKNTALTDKHIKLGAKMVEFAGYNMPIQYSNLIQEHENVRKKVGMFDVSHMGEFLVEGKGALELLQYVTSNDVSKLSPGKVQYSCLPNEQGGIVDDLLVYMMDTDKYMLVVNASNIEKDWNWISKWNEKFGAELKNASEFMSLLAVQGPKAIDTLQKLTKVDLTTIPYYHFEIGNFAGIDGVIISNTGYTGAGGFEIYMKNEDAPKIWDAIVEAGAEYGLMPIGLGARDTLRLEMAFCLYGNDINDSTSPIAAGLGWITKFTKDFINKDSLLQQKEKGTQRKLTGFEMVDKGIPRHDYLIKDASGKEIGIVTSGTQSPSLGKAIGMGYIDQEILKQGSPVYIEVRGKLLEAKIVKTPFYNN